MILYKTVAGAGSSEQTIERSRFISYVKPVNTREEAEAFIAEIRQRHRDARHNVPVMVIGERSQIQWASDDGEPQGTAGAPIVQMLVKEGITNVVLVITRYFGGIKLGTGGLVRAYTSSAKLGIESAGICSVKEMTALKIKIDYTFLNKIKNIAIERNFDIQDEVYEESVTMTLVAEGEDVENIKTALANVTGGTAQILEAKNMLRKV